MARQLARRRNLSSGRAGGPRACNDDARIEFRPCQTLSPSAAKYPPLCPSTSLCLERLSFVLSLSLSLSLAPS